MDKGFKKQAKDFTDEERKDFCEYFYDNWPDDDYTDLETSAPFGCVWDYKPDRILEGKTIKEAADNYYKYCEEEILELMELEKKEEEYDNNEE